MILDGSAVEGFPLLAGKGSARMAGSALQPATLGTSDQLPLSRVRFLP
jgi:hypothetical protein